jgi:glutamate N-acetyltransferase / amino-acid N-acetyltransferase
MVDSTSVNHICSVPGILLASTSAGIYKDKRDDVTLIRLSKDVSVASVFTRNSFAAAPVIIAKKHLLLEESPEFLIINAGNANAGLGKKGELSALETCKSISNATSCEIQAILPFSTGVIGEELPVDKITKVIPDLIANLEPGGWLESARAIMTTDTVEKVISTEVVINKKKITITGIAKGSGMIRPDMATMLAFIGTDASIDSKILQHLLQEVIDITFNKITVDGDTSTNDACVLMATGKGGNSKITNSNGIEYNLLKVAIHKVCEFLAKSIIKDGEGATKFIEVNVNGGDSPQECLQVAYAISHSPLVKTAFFACDPNWGRILAAIGNAGVINLDIEGIKIFINEYCIVKHGMRYHGYSEEQGVSAMSKSEITLTVDLGRGEFKESVWTCDLSHEYVSINADYRS